MNDRPDVVELLRAVERFLEQDAVPALVGVQKFHARVAANVVAMVARELETQESHLRDEEAGLARLLGNETRADAGTELPAAAQRARVAMWNEALVTRIRNGDADAGAWRADVLRHLAAVVARKLDVARPPRQR
jgi:hypothetical protein